MPTKDKYDILEPHNPIFRDADQVREIVSSFGSPTFVYSQKILEQQARLALAFPNAFGLTVRYAMKSNPNSNILRIFRNLGIHIDASSEFEVERAIIAGIPPEQIMLTAQLAPADIRRTLEGGVRYNACSIFQLRNYGSVFPGSEVSVRVNPGLGSGGTNRTNTGGPASSFGVWNDEIPEIIEAAKRYDLKINKIHTHIGSGSKPEIWKRAALMSLNIVERFLDAGYDIRTLNLGGGYKVGRMSIDKSTDLQECGKPIAEAFSRFAQRTGIELRLEIEPGTFLVANAGAVVANIEDLKRTPKYSFIITDTGATEVARPSLYGAQHPIVVYAFNDIGEVEDYIVSGKCCDSGEILTPAEGDPEALRTRRLAKVSRGDKLVVGGAGAYCAGMPLKNYNSYPEAAEVMIDLKGRPHLIRKRQTLSQIIQNEVSVIK